MATTRLQLHLSARDLKNVSGLLSKSDPFAIVTVRGDDPNNPPEVVGQTEVIFNNLNPSWSQLIVLEGYRFGVPLYFEVGIFDFNSKSTGKSEMELSQMDSHTQRELIGAGIATVVHQLAARAATPNGKNTAHNNNNNSSTGKRSRQQKMPHKVMGTCIFETGELLGSRGNTISKRLQLGAGVLTVHVERCQGGSSSNGMINSVAGGSTASGSSGGGSSLSAGFVTLHVRGHKLGGGNHHSFSSQNNSNSSNSHGSNHHPFYEIHRKVDRPTGATWISVYRSHTVRKSNLYQPQWRPVELDVGALCNGDIRRALKIIVWDHRRTFRHKPIGQCETTLQGLLEASSSVHQELEDDDLGFELERDGKPVGRLHVLEATLACTSQTAANAASETTKRANASQEALPEQPGGPQSPARPSPPLATTSMSDLMSDTLQSEQQQLSESLALQHQQRQPEFVDYLSGGCEISLAVAIDFTASNGDPRDVGTPHYFYPPASQEWNDYEKAIFAVGSILAKYDSDQRIPVWGFGAKYNGVVRHCFQCGHEVEVEGVQGIMDAYRGVFRTPLTMSTPTLFTEVVQTATAYALHEQEMAHDDAKLSYTILLILTAGNVENVRETKEELIAASKAAPLSVVIIGIGGADFEGMEFLDDHDPATEGGRDITKFVRFSDFRSFNALTEAVLDEIPNQLVDYFFSRGVLPGAPETFNASDVQVAEADDEVRTQTFLEYR